MTAIATTAQRHIAELADQCVKCGLCVPLCPTYRVSRTEAESPRGRIAFAASIAAGQSPISSSMIDHLDRCLACMTCERVCPSHVQYAELIVETRSVLRDVHAARSSHLMNFLVRHLTLLRTILRIADFPIVRALVRMRIVREAPRLPPSPVFASHKEHSESRGRVGLFLGCVASIADRDVHASARRLLEALGYDVVVPKSQGCCGALALHGGDIEGCKRAGDSTRHAFAKSGVDIVLVSASGCFGTMRDHTFAKTKIRVREIHEFIANDEQTDQLTFAPLKKRIALHTPCTQANVAQVDGSVANLLARIPELVAVPMPTEPRCCGAAGDYFLRQASIADTLRSEKLDQIDAIEPDLLVTSNVGCRSFLGNGLRQRSNQLEVTHPIVLLARQLQN